MKVLRQESSGSKGGPVSYYTSILQMRLELSTPEPGWTLIVPHRYLSFKRDFD